MLNALVHLFATAALLLVVGNVVSGVKVDGFGAALIGTIVMGIVNALVWPLAVLLTLPLTILSLGLFLFILNALMLKLVAGLVPGIRIDGFMPALFGSLLLTVLNWGLEAVLG